MKPKLDSDIKTKEAAMVLFGIDRKIIFALGVVLLLFLYS
ncbi:hypothetical protein LEP1GSC083_0487 [Leptospira interrogans serovar Pyrogenes str. L0374]|uniref:Uncharacterized protein n=1 Tax=Leptospira interrogans serovar Pyrogenes str. L0374 TaxID=1049928 RepID=M6K8T6_LEPIR|nr:hypothetical protein LEP1GSC083_0487 [Leptospira interrogans serovar Pyrogenes str. L0374]